MQSQKCVVFCQNFVDIQKNPAMRYAYSVWLFNFRGADSVVSDFASTQYKIRLPNFGNCEPFLENCETKLTIF